jgi:hypothetical protein
MQRLDFRHRRETGTRNQKPSRGRPKKEDDGCGVIGGFAWAKA